MAGKGKGKSKQQTVAPPFSKRDWAKKHREATVVDAHAHPTVKAALLGRFFRRANKQNPEATLKTRSYRGFNPFVSRTAFPMLQQGGADVLLTAAYAPEAAILPAYLGPRWLVNLVTRLPLLNGIRRKYLSPTYFQATLTMMAALQTAVDQYNDFAKAQNQKSGPPKRRFVEIVPTVTRLEEIVQMESDPPIALIHSVEGAHSLHGDLAGNTLKIVETYHAQGVIDSQAQIDLEIMDNLQDLYDAGVACLTLAHFYPNLVAAPCFPYPGYALKYMDLLGDQDKERIHHDLTQGLTPIGEKVVRRMLHLGMLIDLTHCTPAARNRVYQIADEVDANYRVIASHVGVQAINPDPMNLADWEIEWIARRKGVVGVIFMPYWLQPQQRESGLNALSATIAHVIQTGGEDVIAFGSDFDGFTDPPDPLAHYGQLPRLTERLMGEYQDGMEHYPDALVDKILGGNMLRVLLNGWGKKA